MVNVLLKKYGIREIERERDEFIQFRTIACYSEQFHSRSRRLIYLPLVNHLSLFESCMNSKRNWKPKRQLNAISFEYSFWDHGDHKSEESTRWSSNYGSLKACALSREKSRWKGWLQTFSHWIHFFPKRLRYQSIIALISEIFPANGSKRSFYK